MKPFAHSIESKIGRRFYRWCMCYIYLKQKSNPLLNDKHSVRKLIRKYTILLFVSLKLRVDGDEIKTKNTGEHALKRPWHAYTLQSRLHDNNYFSDIDRARAILFATISNRWFRFSFRIEFWYDTLTQAHILRVWCGGIHTLCLIAPGRQHHWFSYFKSPHNLDMLLMKFICREKMWWKTTDSFSL